MGRLEAAIPVDEIAVALDITEVRREALDGCEGILLTDRVRSRGKILVNTSRGARRARFSIAHEVGHFLMERHVLGGGGGFICGQKDMKERGAKTRHQRQEAEANQFAIALLAPTYKVTPCMRDDPDIRVVRRLARLLDISLEATMRHYLARTDEPIAVVWSHQGRVRYSDRCNGFPWIALQRGDPLPNLSHASRAVRNGRSGVTEMIETTSAAWTSADEVELFEQTRVGQNGYTLTLLWATLPEDDPDGDNGLEELGTPEFRARSRRK